MSVFFLISDAFKLPVMKKETLMVGNLYEREKMKERKKVT